MINKIKQIFGKILLQKIFFIPLRNQIVAYFINLHHKDISGRDFLVSTYTILRYCVI